MLQIAKGKFKNHL